MKIDEASINHNIVRLVKDNMEGYMDCVTDEEYSKEWMIVMLAKIDGIIEMGESMKNLLNM